MKKVLFILSVILLNGCGCMLSQNIKPQLVYTVPVTCTAPLPDYRLVIPVTGNCQLSSYVQTPAAGYLLTLTNPSVTVTLKATPITGNPIQTSFTATMIDSSKLRFNIPPSMLAYTWKEIDQVYTFAESMVKEMVMIDQMLPYDSTYTPLAIGNSYFDGLERVRYTKDGISWLVDKNGIGSWVHNLDGVFVTDTTIFDRKGIATLKYQGQKRIYSLINK